MKIILLEDVKNVGKKGDIIEKSDGYVRNYILPHKLGVEATPKNLNDLSCRRPMKKRLLQSSCRRPRILQKRWKSRSLLSR